jgi:multiple sugar transport system permease protein
MTAASPEITAPDLLTPDASPPGRLSDAGSGLRRILFLAGLILAILFLAPLLWTAVTSIKPPAEASAAPPTGLPTRVDWSNYQTLTTYGEGIISYLLNSIVVSLITITGTLVIGTLAGYGFSRFRFPLKGTLFLVILATLMVPFQSIVIPLFVVLKNLGLTNSLLGVGLVYITFQLPFSIFVMRNAFDRVPRELEESALVDGCTQPRMLGSVMLPLVMPGLVTIGLFAFLAAWNEFFAALILLTKQTSFTLPILLLSARQGLWFTIDWGALQAGVTITMIPCLVFYVVLQRYYVSGLSSGAVKA